MKVYGDNNIFNAAFINDEEDYQQHKSEYKNIEDGIGYGKIVNHIIFPYDPNLNTRDKRIIASGIIDKYFNLTEEMKQIIESKKSKFDVTKTIGVHRRATDIYKHHKIADLQNIYNIIDQEEYDTIFLSSDNQEDRQKFVSRYGSKIIQFDDLTESPVNNLPYFLLNNNNDMMIKHIKEIVSNVYMFSQLKSLICPLSNMSGFSILINPDLQYKIIS